MNSKIFSIWTVCLVACSSGTEKPAAESPPAEPVATETAPVEPAAEACKDPFAGAGDLRFKLDGWKTDFCKHSVPYKEIRGGGPPRDGIPPIDKPAFVSIKEADQWIGGREPIIAFEHGGVARAYPLQILTWHEVVNDRIGGKDVAVTFCPLCYAAIVFERPTVDSVTLTFGTSGNLRNSDLVMWDRQTESWWQQFEGKAIVGKLTGTILVQEAAAIVSWDDFKKAYPSGEVLSKDTGHERAYGKNPYVGYDDVDKKPFLYEGVVDGKRAPMSHVIGVIVGTEKHAFGRDDVAAKKVLNETVGGTPIAVMWRAGVASALDASSIADSRDIGASAVFDRRLEGKTLTFKPGPKGTFVDEQTKSTWSILGAATSGPLKGKRLRGLAHHNVFWFVWSAFVL